MTTRMDWAAALAAIVFITALCFAVLPVGLDWPTSSDVDDSSTVAGGDLIRRFQWMPLFLLAAYVTWRRRLIAAALVRDLNPFLLAFIAYATLSVLWSPVPGIALRRLVVLYGVLLIGLSFQLAGWRPNRFADTVRLALTLLMALSLLLALAMPELGRMPDGPLAGQWRGAGPHKNTLAALAAVGGLFWLHAWATGRASLWRSLAGLGLALVLLVSSGGKTGLATLLATAPVVLLLSRPPVRGPNLLSATALLSLSFATVLVYAALIFFGGLPGWYELVTPVAEMMGRDPSLTSRDRIWALMWEQIRQHWLLGYGYSSFWLGETGPSGEIQRQVNMRLSQSHNGYIDLLNETGLAGVLLLLGFLVTHLKRLWRMALFDADNAAIHFGLLLMVLLANISETSLLRGTSLYWLLLLFSALSVGRALSPGVAQLAGPRTGPRAWVAPDVAVRHDTEPARPQAP